MRGIRIFWICTKKQIYDGTDMKGTDVTERDRGTEERGLLDGVPVLRLIVLFSSEQKLCVSSLIRVS